MIKKVTQKHFFIPSIFALSLAIFGLISYASYYNTQQQSLYTEHLNQSSQTLLDYEAFLSIIKDAETGQRGYLITQDSTYLQPYFRALSSIDSVNNRIWKAGIHDQERAAKIKTIDRLVRRRLEVLAYNIRNRNNKGLNSVIMAMKEGTGKALMDSIRYQVALVEKVERQLLAQHQEMVLKSSQQAILIRMIGSVVSIGLLIWVFRLLQHQIRRRKEAMADLEIANTSLERRVQMRTEELATSNEELAATNEELNASNEELIASNEQLDSKNAELNTLVEQLDTTRQQLSIALASARMGTWQWDISTGRIEWSENLELLHGLVNGDFQSRYGANFEGYQQLIHPEDQETFKTKVMKALSDHTVYDLEFRTIWPDGSIHWMLGRGGAIYDEDGKPLRMVGIGMDITAQKQAEEKIRASEQRYRDLFENNPQPMWIYDVDTLDFLEVNNTALRHFGYTSEEFFAKKAMDLAVPEEVPSVMELVDEVKKDWHPDRVREWILQKKDGSRINVIAVSHTLPITGKQKTRIVMLNDITERKQAEEKLRSSQLLLQAIFEAAADALFLVDAQTNLIAEYNQQAVELFGFKDKLEYKGQRGPSMQTSEYSEEEKKDIVYQIQTKGYWTSEVEYNTTKGTSFWGNAAVSLVHSEEKTYYLIRIRDVTERKLADEAIMRTQQALLEEKRKSEIHLALIEKDNLRKTKELQEARLMQLSMLPQEPPALYTIDMAMFMKTCVEVGGDYYDYMLEEDGTLTVIVGDATGHGLKAGIIVATVKSLFQTTANHPNVVEIMKRISEGIRNLQIRAMYMGVIIVRIKSNAVEVVSSGMPPFLIYRCEQQVVESITLKGPFLGSTLPTPYNHIHTQLKPGDALMLITDGLPELFNQERELLNYQPIEEMYQKVAHLPAQKIIDEIVGLGNTWSNGTPNEDDITLVVLKAK